MIPVKVNICRLNDPPLYPNGRNDLPILHGTVEEVAILEGGMQSGKTSLMITSAVDGHEIALEISAELFRMVASALEGAEQRFLADPH